MTAERCLVLGGSGFLGSHLVELLLAEGFSVRVFGLGFPSSTSVGALPQLEVVDDDFRDPKALANSVEGCQYVFHLISTTVPASSNRDMLFDLETNLLGTVRLLEICVRERVRQIIFSSSGGTVYGATGNSPIPETHPTEPRSAYGITKLGIEKYLALFHVLHGLEYTILRIGNAYGPRLPLTGEQGVVGAFLKCLSGGEPIRLWGDGSVTRDYVYATDVARAFRMALEQRSQFRIFNIGTGTGTSISELIRLMEKATGRQARILTERGRPADVPVNILDPTRARQYLNWEANTALQTGLVNTWNWLRASETQRLTPGARELKTSAS